MNSHFGLKVLKQIASPSAVSLAQEAQRGSEIVGSDRVGYLFLFGWLFEDRCFPRRNHLFSPLANVAHCGD